MKALTFFISIMLVLMMRNSTSAQTFLQAQLKQTRFKAAHTLHAAHLDTSLQHIGLNSKTVSVFIRAFKHEQSLEVWVKHKDSAVYQQFRTYDFCMLSGKLGPKTRQGDCQVPEGFYHIDRFNPWSTFHLSMGINYPNTSDRKRLSGNLGGDIFIHGDCVSIGCIPITDAKIKELYVLCALARNNGQRQIEVHIFPFKMTDRNVHMVKGQIQDKALVQFWDNLQQGFDLFENTHILPKIGVKSDGMYFYEAAV